MLSKRLLCMCAAEDEVPAQGVESIRTVVLGEQFTHGNLPKAIINAEAAPIGQASYGRFFGGSSSGQHNSCYSGV